jgi:hypothetical protein
MSGTKCTVRVEGQEPLLYPGGCRVGDVEVSVAHYANFSRSLGIFVLMPNDLVEAEIAYDFVGGISSGTNHP